VRVQIDLRRLAALLVLCAAGTLVGACDSSSQINTAVQPGAIGQKVRDGTFDFTVTQFNGSRTFRDKRAQGVYVIVALTAKNVGVEPALFVWAAQQLEDSTRRQYSANFMVPSLFGNVVNAIDPGQEVPIKLVFDVPPATKPTRIVLHESASSAGAPVNLTQPPSLPPRHG
jgi:Domain of unknown function (DUF4352)